MDLAPIVDLLEARRNDGTTHWDSCHGAHIDCAAHALLAEVQRVRGDLEWWRARAIEHDPLLELVEISEDAGLYGTPE